MFFMFDRGKKDPKMNKKIFILSLLFLFLPVLALAQFVPPVLGAVPAGGIIGIVNISLTLVWIIFVAIAVIMFVVAGIQFLTAQGDPSKIATARQSVIWGSVGIVVALIAFSVIAVLRGLVGV